MLNSGQDTHCIGCLRGPRNPAGTCIQDPLSSCTLVARLRSGQVVVGNIPMDERKLDLPWSWVGHLES